jgi:carboxypeptidase D
MLQKFLAVVVLAYCYHVVVDGRRILSSSVVQSHTREEHLYAPNTSSATPLDPMSERRKLAAVGTAAPTVDGHKVKNLPGLKSSVKISHYAGHLTVDEAKDGNLFYWLIEAEGIDPATAPLLVWLNGGPGCSSMDGLFLELGPFRLDGDKLDQIKINPGSWHYAANLLFVDQPVGTGLSYTKSNDGYAGSDAAVNAHFYTFLEQFFKLHDRYTTVVNGKRKSRPFFISGESHAGHYIPCIAAHILKKNIEVAVSTDPNALHVDLKGIALGNPWTDPYNQYDVSDFAHGHGLVTLGQRNRLKEKNRECRSLLREGKYNQKVCFDLLDDVIDSSSLSGSHKVLMYDSRRFVHSTGVFPPGHEAVEKYLNRADVKVAIHATATPQPYVECADPPFLALSHQDGKGVVPELVDVLNGGVRLLLYSGQYDIICNHVGSERVLQELPWTGREEYLKAQPGVWLVDRQPAGYIKTYKNLQSLLGTLCCSTPLRDHSPACFSLQLYTYSYTRRILLY